MSDPLTQQAVEAALNNNWQEALDINLKIRDENPEDTDCMNRLGKAYLELGNTKKAISVFKEILKIDKYDPIATKNLLRATQSPSVKLNGKSKKPSTQLTTFSPTNISFLEEPGKTKMVTLVNVAPTKTLLTLRCTDGVNLVAKKHSIFVEGGDGTYLGALPDDLGHRLIVLIKGGNAYEAYVKSVGKGLLVIFLKEKSRSKRFKNTPSFPSGNTDYLSFVREEGSAEENHHVDKETEDGDDEEGIDFKKTTERLHQDEMIDES